MTNGIVTIIIVIKDEKEKADISLPSSTPKHITIIAERPKPIK